MHQGMLNLRQPILVSSGSKTSVLTIARVASEGPDEVLPFSRLTFFMYYSREMGWDLSGSKRVKAASSWRYLLVQISRFVMSDACPCRILFT